MKLTIRQIDHEDLFIEIPSSSSIETVTKEIATKINMPSNLQKLIFRGQILQPESLLSDYNITDGCALHLVQRNTDSTNSTNSQPRTHDPLPPQASTVSVSMLIENSSDDLNINDVVQNIMNSISNSGIGGGGGEQFEQGRRAPRNSSSTTTSTVRSLNHFNTSSIFDILESAETRINSINSSILDTSVTQIQSKNEMVGQLLHKLMMILTQSITPLLQLSELLISNTRINSSMLSLVSQSLSDISVASNSCSQLLTQLQNTSATEPLNSTSAIDSIHRLATDVSETFHNIVTQVNDPLDPLVAGLKTESSPENKK